jgi:hypothetical protein
MARNISVVTTDDLDGSTDAETVSFGLSGVNYEIDLSEANRTRLTDTFAPFITAARKARGGSRRSSNGRSAASPSLDRAAVRAWAREAGLDISERGRISAEVIRQYEAAH